MTRYQNVAVLAGFVFLYSVCASRLERTPVGGPIVYVAFGFLVGPLLLGALNIRVDGEALSAIAELTLAMVLFTVLTRTFRC